MSTPMKPAVSRGWLTVDQVCEELQVSKDTFYDWRKKGRAPKCAKLANGALRIRRTELEKYMSALEETA